MTVSTLIERLARECGLPVLDREKLSDFAGRHEYSALCLFNDPKIYPENSDLAVIVPEILKEFPALAAAIAHPGTAAETARQYGVAVFPALVLLRGNQVRNVLARVQPWSEYRDRVRQLFE